MQLKILLMLLSLILLANCAKEEPVEIVRTEFVKKNVPIQPRPKGVQLNEVKWRVVNQDNLDEFIAEIQEADGFVFYAISPKGYENIALNIAELRRYILQQKEIIIYYEKALR